MRQFLICLLSFTFLLSARAKNTDQDSLTTYQSTDSIVVIGNRIATSIRNLAYSYQSISGQMVEQLSSYSALEMVDFNFPSAYVLENKVLGFGVGRHGAGILNIRGLGGKPNTDVLVLVNGHPDFMAIFGHPLPDVYGNEDIEKVEILAGPSSTVFGDHALGGVVNLVTEPRFSYHVKLHSEMGSYGTQITALSFQKRLKAHGFFFTLRRQFSRGHIPQTNFKALYFQGGWLWQLSPVWELMVQGRYVPYEFDDPARLNIDKLNIGVYGKIKRASAELSLQNKGQKLRGAFQLYTNGGHHQFYDGFKSNDLSLGFSAYQFFQYSTKIAFAAGLDVIRYGGKAKNDFAKLGNGRPLVNAEEHQLTSAGLYGLIFYSPLPQWLLKAGLRYQYNSLPLKQVSPFAGISYNSARGFQVYLNYQTGFRAPTLTELYLFPSSNPDLKNEQVQSLELGSVLNYCRTGLMRLSVFGNKVTDLIQALPNVKPMPPTRFVNGPKSNQWGAEALIKQQVLPWLSAQVAYSYLEPDLLTAYNPMRQIKAGLFLQKANYYVSIYGKNVQDLFAANDSKDRLPNYTLLNFYAGVDIHSFNIYLRILNVLNEPYKARVDLIAPGRQIRVGLRVKL